MKDESKKLADQLKEAEEKRLQAQKENKEVKKNLIFAPSKDKDDVIKPDGSIVKKDGTIIKKDGTVVKKDGTVISTS